MQHGVDPVVAAATYRRSLLRVLNPPKKIVNPQDDTPYKSPEYPDGPRDSDSDSDSDSTGLWIFVAIMGVIMLCILVAAINKYWCGDDVPPADLEDGGKSNLEAVGEAGKVPPLATPQVQVVTTASAEESAPSHSKKLEGAQTSFEVGLEGCHQPPEDGEASAAVDGSGCCQAQADECEDAGTGGVQEEQPATSTATFSAGSAATAATVAGAAGIVTDTASAASGTAV